MADAQIRAVITAEDRASGVLKGVGKSIEGIGNQAKQFLGDAFHDATIAATVGLGVLTVAAVSSVKAFEFSQNTIAQTNAVLESTKGIAGVTAQAVTDLSKSLEHTTKFSDEEVRSAENLLLTFTKIGKDIFPQATTSVLDMATALGEDTKSASIQLGKALQDPILGVTALRRVGVEFSESQKTLIKNLVESGNQLGAQKLILKEIQTEFGGSAVAAGNTFAGSLAKLRNAIDDVQESIGEMIVKSLTPLVQWFAAIVAKVDWDKFLGNIRTKIIELTDKMNQFLEPIKKFIEQHSERFKNWLIKITETTAILVPLMAAMALAWTIMTNPLVIIAGLISLIVINWQTLSTLFQTEWKKVNQAFLGNTAVRDILKDIWSQMQKVWEVISTQLMPSLRDLWVALGPELKIALAILGSALIVTFDIFLRSLVQILQFTARLIEDISKILGLINDLRNGITNAVGNWASHLPFIGKLGSGHAMGGPVEAGVAYPVGEAGPELFIPGQSGRIVPNNQINNPPTINININAQAFMGNQVEARRFAQILVNHINDVAAAKNMSGAQLLGGV